MAPPVTVVLETERIIFGILGVDIGAPSGSRIVKQPLRLFTMFTLTTVWTASVLLYSIIYYTDINVTTTQLAVMIEGVNILMKLVFFVAKRGQFVDLTRKLQTLVEQAKSDERPIWAEANRRSRLVVTIYFIMCCLNALFLLTLPQIHSLLTSGKLVRKLTLESILPYDPLEPSYFVGTYIWWAISIQTIANITSAIDGAFCSFVFNVRAHFDVLSARLKHLAETVEGMSREEFRAEIASFVTYHRSAINIAIAFDAAFSLIIFCNVTIHCLQICFTIFLLGNKSVILWRRLYMWLMFVTIVSQTGIYCFGGEEIQSKSEFISEEIYLQFPWDRMTTEMKRTMVFCLMRAQRPTPITGYFYVVDRQQFVWILKTAFSMKAILSAVDD